MSFPDAAPRTFIEAPQGMERRVSRALDALGDLPEELELPGLDELSASLIELADAIAPDADCEPDTDDEIVAVDDLPLFAAARLT